MQSAAAKDITKISVLAQESDATTADTTTKHSQETAQCSKENRNRPSPNKRTHTQTIGNSKLLRKLLKTNPHSDLIFSNAVKNTSNRTTSKSPTKTNQESQSESSEDDSLPVQSYGHGYYTEGKWK